jgi:hypothetical protein
MYYKIKESMDNKDSDALVELLYQYFDRKGVHVDIKEFNFDFEFFFDINGSDLSMINRILTSLKELNNGVLIDYSTEVEIYEDELTCFFDKN